MSSARALIEELDQLIKDLDLKKIAHANKIVEILDQLKKSDIEAHSKELLGKIQQAGKLSPGLALYHSMMILDKIETVLPKEAATIKAAILPSKREWEQTLTYDPTHPAKFRRVSGSFFSSSEDKKDDKKNTSQTSSTSSSNNQKTSTIKFSNTSH